MNASYVMQLENVPASDRCFLDQVKTLVCDPSFQALKQDVVSGRVGLAVDPDSGDLVPVDLADDLGAPEPMVLSEQAGN